MKISKIKSRKAELTTQQLVTLIVLIASFVVILILIWRLNLGEETDKEICRNSVILRAKSASLSGPIDCRTNYLCISGGNDCEGFPSTKEEINLDGNNDKEEIMKIIADEMADCWWQFGEGKVDYAGGFTEDEVNYALCAKVRFDDKVQKEVSEISYTEFYTYLEGNEKEEGMSYLNYLYVVNDVSLLKTKEEIKIDLNKDKIETPKEYSIFTGIDKNVVDLVDDDEIFSVYIIPSFETASRLDSDRNLITKA